MHVMTPFNGRFKTKRDQEPDRDGEQVKEEVPVAVDRVFRRVDIEHACSLLGRNAAVHCVSCVLSCLLLLHSS